MDFSEFTKQIQNMLTDEEGHYEVSVQTVTKNNGIVYTGLSFREILSGAAPVVYLEPFFERYNNGTSMENITEEIKKIVSENRLDFDAASINDFDNVRNKIVYVLINKIKNADFLKSVPNIDFVGDMVVIFKYELCDGDLAGNATITVTNALQEMWGVTTEILMQCAKENTPRLREPKMASIIDVLKEMAGFNSELIEEIDDDGMMFVLGNKKNINGASVLLDTEFMEHVGSEIGNCYILPSSLHELIAVPADKVEDVSYLKKMVKEVNDTSVSEEDYLSDSIYYFDGWSVTVAE